MDGDLNPGVVWKPGDTVYAAGLNRFVGDATIKDKAVRRKHLDDELGGVVDNFLKGYFSTLFKVGDYFPSDNEDLNERFGGTWARVAKGGFLLGSDDGADEPKYPVGATGGEAEHALNADEMPEHNHVMFSSKYLGNDNENVYSYDEKTRPNPAYAGRTHDADWLYKIRFSADAHEYGKTSLSGKGKAHNNMPPYTVTNWWKKVSDLPPEEFKKEDPQEYKKYFGDS